MFGSVIAQIQFSLIIKKRIGSPKHSLTPHPLTSDFPFIPTPSQSGHHICITPNHLRLAETSFETEIL